jgi:thymidylate synthase (FAD)
MNGSVKIINYNTNASSIVAAAGRISTTQGSAGEIYEKSCANEQEVNEKLITKILSSGHKSVLEHISLNLAFDNVSVFVEQFMIEFRLASFTVKSRRYVDFGKMGYYIPDFSENPALSQKFCAHMDSLFATYDELVSGGVPKEDARFILPYCFKSNFYCTLNARELEKVMTEMVYGRGKDYPELVALGKELYSQCKKILPYLGEEKFSYEGVDELLTDAFGTEKTETKHEDLMEYISGPEEAENIICKTAALSHGISYDTVSLISNEKKKQILEALLKGGRKRELEQAHFTFRFNRISLAGVTHLVRHRMQSIVIPDYTKVYNFEQYVLPQSILDAGFESVYREAFHKSGQLLSSMLEEGLNKKDSVYFLLSGLTIPIVTTMNGNELETFMRLRTCNRAQWEIKECADALLSILREKHPVLFSLYGPACYMLGYCPEGKMTCGKKEEMRKLYGMS